MSKFWRAFALVLALACPVHAAEQGVIEIPTTAPNPAGQNPFGGPTGVASRINASVRAVASQNWGPSAPTNGPGNAPLPYQLWMDTSVTPRVWRIWDTAQWIGFANLDPAGHTLRLLCAALPERTGDVTSAAGSCATAIAANAVTNAKLRQSAGLSVIGRSANSTGDVGDIAGTANQVLRVDGAGAALGFGQLNLASSAAVTGALPLGNGGTGATTASGFLDGFGSSRGQVLYRGAGGWTALNPGTSGQVLSTGGAAGDPSWISVSGTGTVTSVGSGVGLSGGPITSSGTISLAAPLAQGRLSLSGGNIALCPYKGNLLTVNGGANTIPDACVTLAPTGLTAGTTYYVYATASGGAINALEASTTGHVTSTAAGNKGVEVKSGDEARTLVGMARPIAGPAWADTAARRFVRSWANRRGAALTNKLTAQATTGSATLAELDTAARIEWLQWADETVSISSSGSASNATSATNYIGFLIDGAAEANSITRWTGTQVIPVMPMFTATGLSEGYHYASLGGANNGGTTSFGTAAESALNRWNSIFGAIHTGGQ